VLHRPEGLDGVTNAAEKVAFSINKGKYVARLASSGADLRAAQALRALCFERGTARDADPFDTASFHMLIEDQASGALVCCFRLMSLAPKELSKSYAAQFYTLKKLQDYPGLMMELGRFCVHPDWRDPDIVRLAWAAMTDQVDRRGVALLFGCSSFAGLDTHRYLDSFALLKARHLAPAAWMPQIKAPDVFDFAAQVPRRPDVKKAMEDMPPLLRTYLMMGGWVSDHAVVDHQMNTLHVFTGLEIGAIPAGRKRLLRALV
jgi:putative hemolysin